MVSLCLRRGEWVGGRLPGGAERVRVAADPDLSSRRTGSRLSRFVFETRIPRSRVSCLAIFGNDRDFQRVSFAVTHTGFPYNTREIVPAIPTPTHSQNPTRRLSQIIAVCRTDADADLQRLLLVTGGRASRVEAWVDREQLRDAAVVRVFVAHVGLVQGPQRAACESTRASGGQLPPARVGRDASAALLRRSRDHTHTHTHTHTRLERLSLSLSLSLSSGHARKTRRFGVVVF